MKYYVVADVHSYYTPLRYALQQAGFFDETEPCRLVVCGDLFDRGREAVELQDFLVQLLREDRLILIRGNHEDLLLQLLELLENGAVWDIANGSSHHVKNGTWGTVVQLSGMEPAYALVRTEHLVKRMENTPFFKKLLPAMVNYFETEHYVFVHGWIPCHTNGSDWRQDGDDEWAEARWHNGIEMACRHHFTVPGKTVVCGHFHASFGHARVSHKCSEFGEDADFTPFYGDGIIALDACTAYSGFVNCIVLED